MAKKKKKRRASRHAKSNNLLKIAALAVGIYLLVRKPGPAIKPPTGNENPQQGGNQAPVSGLRNRLRQRQTV